MTISQISVGKAEKEAEDHVSIDSWSQMLVVI
jgi:hypothetical protein